MCQAVYQAASVIHTLRTECEGDTDIVRETHLPSSHCLDGVTRAFVELKTG